MDAASENVLHRAAHLFRSVPSELNFSLKQALFCAGMSFAETQMLVSPCSLRTTLEYFQQMYGHPCCTKENIQQRCRIIYDCSKLTPLLGKKEKRLDSIELHEITTKKITDCMRLAGYEEGDIGGNRAPTKAMQRYAERIMWWLK